MHVVSEVVRRGALLDHALLLACGSRGSTLAVWNWWAKTKPRARVEALRLALLDTNATLLKRCLDRRNSVRRDDSPLMRLERGDTC